MIFRHRRGVVLIIVMIVVSGLSILAFGLAFRARVRIKTFGLNIQNVQAYHLAMGGLEKGKVFLVEEVLSDDPFPCHCKIALS
jgi:type II secretory pathway component PulK